jgi:hypothetical protein
VKALIYAFKREIDADQLKENTGNNSSISADFLRFVN